MVESSLLRKFDDQVGSGLNHFLISGNFLCGKAIDVLPPIGWQKTGGIVKAIFGVRPFYIHLDLSVGQHLRVNNFRIPVDLQKWVHHSAAHPFLPVVYHIPKNITTKSRSTFLGFLHITPMIPCTGIQAAQKAESVPKARPDPLLCGRKLYSFLPSIRSESN
jgi:hypothetical protein